MEYELKKLCKIKHGFAFTGKKITNYPTQFILVTPGNFKIGGGFKDEKFKYFNTDGLIPKEYILSANDLIVTMTDLSVNSDTLGYAALIPDDGKIYLHNQRIGLVYDINTDIILKDYLYWFMRTHEYQRKVVSSQSGTAIHHTSPDRILNIKMNVPELHIQKKIINLLNNLDYKIKINNQTNDNLYEIGLSIYKEKYIKNVNCKFKKLNTFFPVVTGKKDANASSINGKYSFFTCSKNVLKIDSYSFDTSALLLAGNGDFNVKFYKGRFDAYQRTYVLVPYDKNKLGFLYFSLKYNLKDLTSGYRGSVIKFITKGNIENYVIPDIEDKKYENAFNEILSKIEQNNNENELLSNLRDTLLPRLMNGEIDLNNIKI